ncbi:MAG: glycosyl hydrolase 115 family protein [Bacteroidaceae bacterium]|nr:glycosyl hydrolase 115 family protein [Bacteroidaceae bacterium]
MRKLFIGALALTYSLFAQAIDLAKATIVYDKADCALTAKMAGVLADDIERVTGVRPAISTEPVKGNSIVLATLGKSRFANGHTELAGEWERYAIDSDKKCVRITGSDARGLAYGVFHVSEKIGVSPWYWWADVPVERKKKAEYEETIVSKSPSVKYRGIFINDEDWGLKVWAAKTFEPELGDIGPKTYDKVCELILRLRGNMLAPAMHSCTGAFYTHPESQVVADSWGIMITTSHCEPLLFNNASKLEWDTQKDGEWNYVTNGKHILEKLDKRIKETAQYDNIYTVGMRGLHDGAMKGPKSPEERARVLEQVISEQRKILSKYKKRAKDDIPQIFVPYKETLDVYDAGLDLPEDVTIVWPDDNYGYMKRVSSPEERKRKGGSGVYYHISYLGTPHDYLWMNTTPPVFMYEELKKAYDAGADRYWLLNVGDIKPMELGIQTFMDMAWDMESFTYEKAYNHQTDMLCDIFGKSLDNSDGRLKKIFGSILDFYYRPAWDRKPEYMGYEIEWDSKENERLHDAPFDMDVSRFSPKAHYSMRYVNYGFLESMIESFSNELPDSLRTSFFELIGYSALSAINNDMKFLAVWENHQTGSDKSYKGAQKMQNNIDSLLKKYNTMLDGKWNGMMSEVPPGLRAQYQKMPELVTEPTDKYKLPKDQLYTTYDDELKLDKITPAPPFRMIEGMGTNWNVIQLGDAYDKVEDPTSLSSSHIDIPFVLEGDSVKLQISTVPVWPLYRGRSNRFGVSVDGCKPVVCENKIVEWSYPWKLQVLNNRKDYLLTLPVDKTRTSHTLTLVIGDPGQMIQMVTYSSF